MKIFLDTSSLFKLYHFENDSQLMMDVISNNHISEIFLSELSKIEFNSTIWKKVRTGDLTENQRTILSHRFEADHKNYSFIHINHLIASRAKLMIDKYGNQGLRTLDSIQLSTAISLRDTCDRFITSDKLLHNFFLQESLKT